MRALFSALWERSMRRQLIIGVALVHLLLMTIFVFDLVHRQRRFLLEGAERRVLAQSEMLAATSVHLVISYDLSGLSELLTSLAADQTVRYAIVSDPNGRVLAHTNPEKVGGFLRDPRSLEALQGGSEARILEQGKTSMTAIAPVLVKGKNLAWVFVGRDLTADRAYLDYVTRAGLLYTLAAILIGTGFAVLLARNVTRPLRLLLAGAGRVARGKLDTPVPITTENEVGQLAVAFNDMMEDLSGQERERKHAENELRQAHAGLERKVEERTGELQRTNQALRRAAAEREQTIEDLEAFSYSVSHDLRSPLRAIGGFSNILLTDYAGTLDQEGRRLLDVILDGTKKMDLLIANLLQFARVGKTELTQGPVDVTLLGQTVAWEILRNNRERTIELVIGKLPSAHGDLAMLRQVLDNLMGNAVKYTRPRAVARIEVGGREDGAESVYWVRDNGVGFDMKYVSKLFGVFKRLHGEEQFEGTGVGLALVQRIVQRHGGRVWAVGKLNEGAAFYWSLPRHQDAERPDDAKHREDEARAAPAY